MSEIKKADTKYKILDLLENRWSPRAFDSKHIESEKIQRVFEAARWSPSAFNEQPWCFIIGIKGYDSTYDKIFDTLAEPNKIWAKTANILVVNCCCTLKNSDKTENPYCNYDLGQAVAYLTVQATAEGLYVHQMAGFSKQKAINNLEIPDNIIPITVMAIGYEGNPDVLPEHLKKIETSKRIRKDTENFVFSIKYGNTHKL